MPLPPPHAALVRVSAAIAAGGGEDVAGRGREALEAGLSAAQLYETALQSYLFLGFPRAIEAFFALAPILETCGSTASEEGIDPARWQRSGEELCRRVYGRNYEKLLRVMRDLSPDLAEWMILEGYGKTLSRPGLSPREREYGIVAILTVTRMWRQLRSHAIGTVNVGGTRTDVKDVITLCTPWCGTAVTTEALAVTGIA